MVHFRAPLLVLCLALGGCTPLGLAVGAGATAGVAASQERGAVQAAKDTGTQLAINRALLEKSGTLFQRVSSTVVEGRVLLTGIIASHADRDEVTRIAYTVESVREAINELEVGPSNAFNTIASDTRITTSLRSDLLGDKQIVDINYSIDTVNGTIYLMGIAQNQAELDRVIAYARAISGVRRVVSHVVMKDDPRRPRG
jgi:osmotically-inducible protein OsmY